MLPGRIVFRPSREGYTFETPTRFDKLFSGIAIPRPSFIERSTKGTEHIGPEDTFDGDYGRLLEAVCGKWVASPSRRAPFRVFAMEVGIDFSGALRVG